MSAPRFSSPRTDQQEGRPEPQSQQSHEAAAFVPSHSIRPDDINPNNFALRFVQRLGPFGMDMLETSIRGVGAVSGVTGARFIESSERCLSVCNMAPGSCSFPWQRKGFVHKDVVSYDVECSASFLPEVVTEHGGLNFVDVARGYPFHTERSKFVARRETSMGKFLDKRAKTAAFDHVEVFESAEALHYALSMLFHEIDKNQRDIISWEDITAFLADVTTQGKISCGKRPLRKYYCSFKRKMEVPDGGIVAAVEAVHRRRIIVATAKQTVMSLDSNTLESRTVYSYNAAARGNILRMEYIRRSFGQDYFAVASADCKLLIYCERGGTTLDPVFTCPYGTQITALRYIPSLRQLFCGCHSGIVSACHVASPVEWVSELFSSRHTNPVVDFVYIAGKSQLLVALANGLIQAYDADTKETLFELVHQHVVNTMSYSDHFGLLATGGEGTCPYLWVPGDRRCVAVALRDADVTHKQPIVTVRFVDASPELFSLDVGGVLKVWDVRSMACVQTIVQQPHPVMFQYFEQYARFLLFGVESAHKYSSCATADDDEPVESHPLEIKCSTVYTLPRLFEYSVYSGIGRHHSMSLAMPPIETSFFICANAQSLYVVDLESGMELAALPLNPQQEGGPQEGVVTPALISPTTRSTGSPIALSATSSRTSLTSAARNRCPTESQVAEPQLSEVKSLTVVFLLPDELGEFASTGSPSSLPLRPSEPQQGLLGTLIVLLGTASGAVITYELGVRRVSEGGAGWKLDLRRPPTTSSLFESAITSLSRVSVIPFVQQTPKCLEEFETSSPRATPRARTAQAFAKTDNPALTTHANLILVTGATGAKLLDVKTGVTSTVLDGRAVHCGCILETTKEAKRRSSAGSGAAAENRRTRDAVFVFLGLDNAESLFLTVSCANGNTVESSVSIRSMPDNAVISNCEVMGRISCVVAADDVGGIHISSFPIGTSLYPTVVARMTFAHPKQSRYTPRCVAVRSSFDQCLMFAAGGNVVAVYSFQSMVHKAFTPEWKEKYPQSVELLSPLESAIEQLAGVSSGLGAVDDRLKSLPPSPQLACVFEVACPRICGMELLEARRALLISGCDGAVRLYSYHGKLLHTYSFDCSADQQWVPPMNDWYPDDDTPQWGSMRSSPRNATSQVRSVEDELSSTGVFKFVNGSKLLCRKGSMSMRARTQGSSDTSLMEWGGHEQPDNECRFSVPMSGGHAWRIQSAIARKRGDTTALEEMLDVITCDKEAIMKSIASGNLSNLSSTYRSHRRLRNPPRTPANTPPVAPDLPRCDDAYSDSTQPSARDVLDLKQMALHGAEDTPSEKVLLSDAMDDASFLVSGIAESSPQLRTVVRKYLRVQPDHGASFSMGKQREGTRLLDANRWVHTVLTPEDSKERTRPNSSLSLQRDTAERVATTHSESPSLNSPTCDTTVRALRLETLTALATDSLLLSKQASRHLKLDGMSTPPLSRRVYPQAKSLFYREAQRLTPKSCGDGFSELASAAAQKLYDDKRAVKKNVEGHKNSYDLVMNLPGLCRRK